LVREGFTGPTWCTPGTAALAAIVLRDSAYLQEEDAENARLWGVSRHDPPQPLYNAADAEKAITSFKPMDYHQDCALHSGAHLSFSRAGHILGSASALVTIGGGTVLFSGDLGRTDHPLLLATGGRVVHHHMYLLPEARHTVILTGYQAVGTRGRQLAEGATELKMFGRYVPVRAEVVFDHGFSVHADATELLTWLQALPTAPETVYIVHGKPQSARALAAKVRAETGWCAVVPELGE
jgi:Cft2 family RNA processing exonuclease